MKLFYCIRYPPFFLSAPAFWLSVSPEKNKEIVVPENGNKTFYGTIDKDTVYAYTIKNNQGLKAVISNYGGTLLELWTPDKSGIREM